ncbi:MAG: outer membrane protein transport protein [Candidatus Electryonea clarkiae]|nr:outer membrane protein transport protein [Candidatus Electryonea clarkiae]MDP8285231.1 outer membrane protein transport protein [Candidatus Electryonea clarkiae]
MYLKRKLFAVVTLLLFLVMLPGISAAGGYNLAGVGAKALSMSGAYRAIADDYSAMFWNPAGLAGQGTALSIEVKSLFPMVWVTPNMPEAYPGYSGYRNGVEETTRAKAFPAGSFGMTYMINEKMTAGLSVFAPSALGAVWENLHTGPPHGYNNNVAFPDDAWFSDLKVIDIHPSIGYQAMDNLKLGLGLGIIHGSVILGSPTLLPSGTIFPVEHFYSANSLEGDGWGFGFNLGAIYDVTETIHFGVTYKGETVIPLEGSVKQNLILPNNPGIVAMDPTQALMFSGGNLTAEPKAEADFTLPMEAGFGLAYDVNDRLTVAFDGHWTNWGAIEVIDILMDGTGPTGAPSEDSELLLNYEDTFRINAGMSYLLCPDKGHELYLGFYSDPTPIPDAGLRPTITDVADKYNISIGGKYNINEKMFLQAYWEHLFSGERTVEPDNFTDDGTVENLPGVWKMQVDTFGLTFGYIF